MLNCIDNKESQWISKATLLLRHATSVVLQWMIMVYPKPSRKRFIEK